MSRVAEISWQTIKAESIIIILSSKKTIHIETLTPPERSIPIPTSAYNHTTTPHSLPQQQQQQRRYADVASNHAQLAEEPITTLKAFLEDYMKIICATNPTEQHDFKHAHNDIK